MNKLRIFKNNQELFMLSKGTKEIDLQLNSSDKLYIGYEKPINTLYFNFKTPNTQAINLTVKRSVQGGFEAVNTEDETYGMNNDGFIYLPEAKNPSKLDINNLNLHWIEITGETSLMKLRFLDVIFAAEDQLVYYSSYIDRYLPKSGTFLHYLIASTDKIVNTLNNSGKMKVIDNKYQNITRYDVLNVSELKNACISYTLYLILNDMADSNKNDVYSEKAQARLKEFENDLGAYASKLIHIDTNNDGKSEELDEDALNDHFFYV